MEIGEYNRPWRSVHLSDPKMTGSSKSIRQEVLAVLHAEAIFSMQASHFDGWEGLTRDDIPFIDQVQKVEILDYPDRAVLSDGTCYREFYETREENKKLSKKGAEPLSLFIGTGVPRNICVVSLIIEKPKAILMIHSPFFDAIRRLTDFKTLTLEIESVRDTHTFYDNWSEDVELTYLGGNSSQMDHAGAVNVIAESMKGALEPSLGPSTMSEERLEKVIPRYLGPSIMREERLEKAIRWEIEFHPREYLAKKAKSESRRESGGQGERGTSRGEQQLEGLDGKEAWSPAGGHSCERGRDDSTK